MKDKKLIVIETIIYISFIAFVIGCFWGIGLLALISAIIILCTFLVGVNL